MSAMTPKTTPVGRVGLSRVLATGLLAAAAALSFPAFSQPGGPPSPGMGWAGGGPGMGGHPMGVPGMGEHGMAMGNPAHLGRMLDHMLDGLNATEAQRAQIRQIALAAAVDLRAQHQAGRALREKGLQLLVAPTVDAAAAESLRQQMLVQHDQASKRLLQALLDVSKVLTPEQRAKLGERWKMRAERMQEHQQRLQHAHPASEPKS